MADLLKMLFRRIQEGMEGVADAIVGDRADRLLDDEIRTIGDALHEARARHAEAKAHRIANDRHLDAAKVAMVDAEAKVESALRRNRKAEARRLAVEVVRLQAERDDRALCGNAIAADERRQAHEIEQLDGRLRRVKHQLDILRATSSLQQAQRTIARRQSTGQPHPESAFASVERIGKQTKVAAKRVESVTKKTPQAVDDPAQAVLDRVGKRVHPSPRKRRT